MPKKCKKIRTIELELGNIEYDGAMEFDGLLITWASTANGHDVKIDGWIVYRNKIEDVFCATAHRVDFVRKRGSKLTFQFTDTFDGVPSKPDQFVEHVIDTKTMRWDDDRKPSEHCKHD